MGENYSTVNLARGAGSAYLHKSGTVPINSQPVVRLFGKDIYKKIETFSTEISTDLAS